MKMQVAYVFGVAIALGCTALASQVRSPDGARVVSEKVWTEPQLGSSEPTGEPGPETLASRAPASEGYDRRGLLNALAIFSRGGAVDSWPSSQKEVHLQASYQSRPKHNWVSGLFEGKSRYLDNEEVETG